MKEKYRQPELPNFGRKNLFLTAELPPDFAEKARAADLTPEQLLWNLALDYCLRAPKTVVVVKPIRTRSPRRPPNVISFRPSAAA